MTPAFDTSTEILRAERLDLVPLSQSVCQAVLDGQRDRVAELLGVDPGDWPRETERRHAFPGYLSALRRDPSLAAWLGRAIVLRDDAVIIGSVNLKGPPSDEGQVEIGYGLIDTYQRRGYAREAVAALLAHLFDDPAVRVVVAHIEPGNTRSVRLVEALGFGATGVASRQHRDHAIWLLDRDTYRARD